MNWKNLNLYKKFLLGFGVLIGILVLYAVLIETSVLGIMNSSDQVVEANSLQDKMSKRYNDHLKWTNALGEYVLHPFEHSFEQQTDHHKCKFGEWYYSEERKRAEELIPELAPLFQKLEQPHELLHKSAIEIKDTIAISNSANKDIVVQDIYEEHSLERLKEVALIFDEINKLNEEYIAKTNEGLIEEGNSTSFKVVITSIILTLLSILFAFVITRGIVIPLKKSMTFAEQISDGDLTAKIDLDQNDETGKLANSLKKMRERLKDVIHEVISGVETLEAASTQLTASSHSMSESASQQAAAAEEVSSSMEEMNANIQQNTDNAYQTEKIAVQATNEIQDGSQAVNQTVDAMKTIAGKISIITDIAFQTNILALNAAVEAARAGEHGRGFAVVAAEVRKLAERSHIAANEINQITGSSVEIAERSGKLLENIVPNIQKTSKLVQEIAASSAEMSSGSGQVNNAIQQLTQSTQENAATSEEISSASEELSSQAQRLFEAVSYFKVENSMRDSSNKNKYQTTAKKSPAKKPSFASNSQVRTTGVNLRLTDNNDNNFETF
jgi:methyl-accepting chemotaxis protein